MLIGVRIVKRGYREGMGVMTLDYVIRETAMRTGPLI